MDKDLFDLTSNLKEAIKNDERIKELDSIEKEMNESKEVIFLYNIKEEKLSDYNFAISHFSDSSKEAENARKALYDAKKKLEEHPIVRKYLSAYSKVREMNEEISDSLFSIINIDLCKAGEKL